MNLPSTSKSNIDPDYVLAAGSSQPTTNVKEQEPDEWISRVKNIINREFIQELDAREKQIHLIQRRTAKACKMLHLIRYVLINSYYNNSETVLQELDEEEYQLPDPQGRLHPAIKKLLGSDQNLHILNKKRQIQKPVECNSKQESEEQCLRVCNSDSEISQESNNSTNKNSKLKKSCELFKHTKTLNESSNSEAQTAASIIRNRVSTKHVIIVGNISKYIPSKNPNDKLVHKWMVYVRGPKETPDISGFVNKVVFYLHPSYKPNDVVEIDEYPFHLTRRGWGEFPLRVQIFFKNNYNKPVDIIHTLRLDKTYVFRQTLGSETVAQVSLYDGTETSNYFNETGMFKNEDISQNIDISEDTDTLYKHIKIEAPDIPDQLFTDEKLDTNSFLINKLNTVEHIKQEVPEDLLSQYNTDQFNNTSISPDDVDFDVLESQQNVDEDHNYSRYTILNGIKRKIDEIPIHHCKRFKYDNHSLQNEDFNPNNSIKIYDISRLRTAIQMIKMFLKKMPLVTHLACNTNYKSIFPYAATNLFEYSCWNIAKRQASEWGRARMVRNALINSGLPNSMNWSTEKIVLFARAYGFTPLPIYAPFRKLICQQHLIDIKAPSLPRMESPIKSDNLQVDITNNSMKEAQLNGFSKSKIFMNNPITEKYEGFVKEAAFEMGVILREDEIVPGVCYNTTETLLLKAVMCFADDLLRCARADAVYKGQLKDENGCIRSENVINALNTYREEFTHVTTFNKYTKLF